MNARLGLTLAIVFALHAHAQAGDRKPNVLFCIADDWSAPHASAYGCRFVKTPGFDRIAKEGVLFRNGFVTSPGCSPSRASILTGKQPWQLREAGTHSSSFPADLAVYPNLLRQAGYFVGMIGKGWGPGNFTVTQWQNNPAGPGHGQKKLTPPHAGISGTDYAASFKQFLAQKPKGQPFCFWCGVHEPHRPFTAGMGVKSRRLEDVDVPPFLPDTKEIRGDLLDYAIEIEWFDRQLSQILQILEELGELDNTIIVVIGDNGMAFPYAKANLTEYGIHVPLAIRWGDARGGRTVDDLVSMIDLAPTFLEAAGLKIPSDMMGKSLVSVLRSSKSGLVDESRDRIFAGRERHSSARTKNLGYPSRCIRTKDFLFVRNFAPDRWPAGDPVDLKDAVAFHDIDAGISKAFLCANRDDPKIKPFFDRAVAKRPAEELFDLRKDPGCMVNVAESVEYAKTRNKLRVDLDEYLRRTDDARATEHGEVWETYPRYAAIRKFPGDKE